MCWDEPFDSLPIKHYEIEFITHGYPKCRREETNRWDLPRADVSGVRIRAVDECGQNGDMFNVTLNLYSNGKTSNHCGNSVEVFNLIILSNSRVARFKITNLPSIQ